MLFGLMFRQFQIKLSEFLFQKVFCTAGFLAWNLYDLLNENAQKSSEIAKKNIKNL